MIDSLDLEDHCVPRVPSLEIDQAAVPDLVPGQAEASRFWSES